MMCGSQVYHGTPHHQAASLAAKDAEISQLASALNKAKEENGRLREALGELSRDQNWDGYDWVGIGFTGKCIAKEALK